MGLSGSLRALVLLSLLAVGCRSAEPESKEVNIDTLARIIQFFNNNYKQDERQYTVAINVPEDQCKINFVPNENNFLKEESSTNVINKIYDENVALYEGQELIAAAPLKKRTSKQKQKKQKNQHSEHILMNPPRSSPMTNLLNQKKDGCVIFYTYNLPCYQTCISSEFNILGALEEWSKHGGLKAFVFQKIWKYDENDIQEAVFKAITQYVPLYQCEPSNGRYECVQKGNINQNGQNHVEL